MNRPPATVSATFMLMILNALIWTAFSALTAFGGIASISQAGVLRWLMAGLGLAAAAVLACTVLLLRRRSRIAYSSAIAVLAAIAVLSITDQVGILDLVSLSICLIPLLLLVKDRSWHLGKSEAGG